MMLSVNPSLRYSISGLSLPFTNGKTAIDRIAASDPRLVCDVVRESDDTVRSLGESKETLIPLPRPRRRKSRTNSRIDG